MLFSSVIPAPGTDLASVIRVIETEALNLANLPSGAASERLAAYQNWASQASSQLRYVLELPQVEALIDTRRHDFLFDMYGGPESLLNQSISAEQEDRARAFKGVLDGLRGVKASCEEMPKALIIPDTNIYLHQDKYFHELEWRTIVETSDEVRLLVPMQVMREIDNAKRTAGGKSVSYQNKEAVRDRARLTSKQIRGYFEYPQNVAELEPQVTMELLMDPRGHRPIADGDSEIIDRALALQTMSGWKVSIVTSDGNMQFGADVAGLQAILLPDSP